MIQSEVRAGRTVNLLEERDLPIKIEQGGSGARDAASARTNLGAVSASDVALSLVNYVRSQNAVNALAQTAAIASTNLLTAPTPGLYRITADLSVLAAIAAGTVTLNLGWNNGAPQTRALINLLTLTALGPAPASTLIYVASGDVTYATVLAGVIGSPSYDLRLRAELIP